VRVVAPAPAQVAGVAINDGSAQRSMVNGVIVTFDGDVTLVPRVFEVSRPDGSLVGLIVAASVVNGRTVAVLSFAGPTSSAVRWRTAVTR
jgi:hypothetical protein